MPTESAKVSDDLDGHEAVVAGAGSAGLAAAAALQERGFETTVLESSGAVGARWRSRYEELRLNSWRVMSNLRGYRMPRSCGRYPGRDDFVAYLEDYAAHHRLRVRFHTKLVRVERAGDLWRLETSAHPMFARYVVIATGWDAVPVLPDWPGRESFVPELIHSSDFRGGRGYAGRDVVVVGFGNSGIVRACSVCRRSCLLAVRGRCCTFPLYRVPLVGWPVEGGCADARPGGCRGGNAPAGERWYLKAGGSADDYYTLLETVHPDGHHDEGGMGGPVLSSGHLLRSIRAGPTLVCSG
jgi:hypothetical protein